MNTGKYASVGDLPFTGQKISYHRGYGNIVIHDIKNDNNISTNITKFNRIEPLTMPFGMHLPKNDNANEMLNPETTLAWTTTPLNLNTSK